MLETDLNEFKEHYQKHIIRKIKKLLAAKGPITKTNHKLPFFFYYNQVKNNVKTLKPNATDNNGIPIETLLKQGYFADFKELSKDLENIKQ
jgi:hypothetical protein